MRTPVLAAVLGLGLAAGVAGAQPTPPPAEFPGGGCAPGEVPADGLCWDVPADEPVVACLVSATEGLAGREAVTVKVFLRQPDGVAILPTAPADPVGPFADAPVATCLGLEALP